MTEPPGDVIAALEDIRRRRKAAAAEQRQASAELPDLIRAAMAREIPVTEIARAAGISRQAVYDFLHK